ncbi:MAG: nitrilase family protein [Bacteroidales bacterium]|nr:nitrilase family protein [Bacteroidales bacterium]
MLVTLCSTDIKWEDKAANFKYLHSLFLQFDFKPDIIVLPEMFNTGFTMNISMAEDIPSSPTLKWMQEMASKFNSAIIGSFPVLNKNNNLSGSGEVVFNRAFFVLPDGSFKYYDKHHLFRMGEENSHYTPGEERTVVKFKGVRFALNVCYDLRFPVWSRNVGNEYDVLVNVANFPAPRAKVIEPLCRARAIENIAYMLFVNRVGEDPQCKYVQSSYAVDYKGDIIGEDLSSNMVSSEIDGYRFSADAKITNVNIDIDKLNLFREKFPAWMDADKFELN